MARHQKKAEKDGSNTPLLLVILLVLLGLGAWNYRRNVALEASQAQVATPYASLSSDELDALQAAYQGEIDRMRRAGGADRRAGARGTSGVQQSIREFERVQRVSRSAREAGYEISEREAIVRTIELEKTRRGAQAANSPQAQFLRRAFTVSF